MIKPRKMAKLARFAGNLGILDFALTKGEIVVIDGFRLAFPASAT